MTISNANIIKEKSQVTAKDLRMIVDSLGRPPRGCREVCCRDHRGGPVVISVDPIVDGKLFPTFYWLVHKGLLKEISRIESQSFIKYLEKNIIANNKHIKDILRRDTNRYQKQRWTALSSCHQYSKIQKKYRDILKDVGIGGIRDKTRVRCLHMHYAHYLVDSNIIGQILEEQFHLSKFMAL